MRCNDIPNLLLGTAFPELGIHVQILLDPTIEGLVNRVASRLAGPGHGPFYQGVLYKIVVSQG
jgi:hypothetical protein